MSLSSPYFGSINCCQTNYWKYGSLTSGRRKADVSVFPFEITSSNKENKKQKHKVHLCLFWETQREAGCLSPQNPRNAQELEAVMRRKGCNTGIVSKTV